MKVSIITVCLNSKKTIAQTIESVLNQTYKNIEYIVIDGKSTDGTINVIQSYALLFAPRLKWISERDMDCMMNKEYQCQQVTLWVY